MVVNTHELTRTHDGYWSVDLPVALDAGWPRVASTRGVDADVVRPYRPEYGTLVDALPVVRFVGELLDVASVAVALTSSVKDLVNDGSISHVVC